MDFPSSFARYPFIDPADESVDGGVADKIGDDDRVSFLDRLLLSRWRRVFELSPLFDVLSAPISRQQAIAALTVEGCRPSWTC